MDGLYKKYDVKKVNGDTDPEADYFTLRIDTDESARKALRAYAVAIKSTNPKLSMELFTKLYKYEKNNSEG